MYGPRRPAKQSFRIGPPGKRPIATLPAFAYTTAASKCKVDEWKVGKRQGSDPYTPKERRLKIRQSCPVQLVFVEGVPHLRFCYATGKPGPLVRATSPADAQKIAESTCACWHKNNRSFSKCKIKSAGLRGLRSRGR